MTIRVTGLKETVSSLEQLGVQVTDLKDAMTRIGSLVGREAYRLARKKSGRMAGSITPGRAKSKAIIRAGAGLAYARVQHYGWPAHGITPNPFLTDAAEHKQREAVAELRTELTALIRRNNL